MSEAGFTSAGKQQAPARGGRRAATCSNRSTWPRSIPASPPVRWKAQPDRRSCDDRGRLRQPPAIEDEASPSRCRCCDEPLRPRPEVGGLVGEERGGPGERLPDARVEALLEVRQQLVADTVPQVGRVGVRGILAPGEAPRAAGARGSLARGRPAAAAGDRRARAASRRDRSRRRRAGGAAAASRPGRPACARPRSSAAPSSSFTRRRNEYRSRRAACSSPPFSRPARARTGALPPRKGTPSVAQKASQKAASSAEPGRRPWSRCAATSRKPWRRCSEASTSAARPSRRRPRVRSTSVSPGAGGRRLQEPDRRPRRGTASSCDRASARRRLVAVQGFEPRTPRI